MVKSTFCSFTSIRRKAGFIGTEADRLVAVRVGQSRNSLILGCKAIC